MTDEGARRPPVPGPPPPPGRPGRQTFDGAFAGPILPPAPRGFVPDPPAVTEAVLALPLGTRKLVGQALDLLTRRDSGLRPASFYIGFIALLTIAPVMILVGVGLALGVPMFDPGTSAPLDGPIVVAALVAMTGYLLAGVESRTLATAVIGGRAEGRPLSLRSSIAVTRRRFWRVFLANLVVGFTTLVAAALIQLPLQYLLGNTDAINQGLSLLVGTLIAAPFTYVPAGIVLGEVGPFEAIPRSFRLARARPRLAVVVAVFGVLSQFIVLFGISIGGDVVLRIVDGSGLADAFPAPLVVPVVAALVFAFGTLVFLVESISAAPAVHAFEALTHYTHGLQTGRDHPAPAGRLWQPWLTPGLALLSGLGLLALVVGIARLP